MLPPCLEKCILSSHRKASGSFLSLSSSTIATFRSMQLLRSPEEKAASRNRWGTKQTYLISLMLSSLHIISCSSAMLFTPDLHLPWDVQNAREGRKKNRNQTKTKKPYNRHNVVSPSSHMGSEPVQQTLVGAMGLGVQVPIAAWAHRLQNDYNTHKAEQSSPALLPATTF